MKAIVKKITDYIASCNMFPTGAKLLCAVSGGADSMCLLHFLHSNAQSLGIEVSAAHFEHGIRGEESLRDCCFVKDYCKDNKIEFICEHGNVLSYAETCSIGIEEAARVLRYAFLERAAIQLGCTHIATAHNCDDNAETVLFNLLRGSGAKGLCGIPPVRGNIVRPLLCLSRSEIEEYLRENGVPHVEDSSNFSDDYSRNIIRHSIIPVMRRLNPACSQAILSCSALLRSDEEVLSSEAENFINEYFFENSLPIEALKQLPVAVSSRVIRKLCPQQLTASHVSSVLLLLDSTERKCLDLPGITLVFEKGRVSFGEREPVFISPMPLAPEGHIVFEEAGIEIFSKTTVLSSDVYGLLNTFALKYDEIAWPLVCSSAFPGDRMRPYKRGCTKSLKSLFSEKGFTKYMRCSTPVFRDENGVAAVFDIAVSERVHAEPGDKILQITVNKISGV